MNKFWHILLSFVMLIGLSVAISAQRNDDKQKPPPKDPKESPKIEPRPKPPRDNPRDDKPKKPGSGFSLVLHSEEKYFA